MFLLHDLRQGFIHIARTGGRYVESQVEHRADFEMVNPRHRYRLGLYPDYQWHMVVRDPVERFQSLYDLWSMDHRGQDPVTITHNLSCPAEIFFSGPDFVDWFCQRHIRYASHWTEQHFYLESDMHVWHMRDIDALLASWEIQAHGEPINQSPHTSQFFGPEQQAKIRRHYEADYWLWDFRSP